jgi:hypothetical protein
VTQRIALATAAEFPDLDEDGSLLLGALSRVGLHAEPAVWTDEGVVWSSYDVVVVRSTWDYFYQRDTFLEWADRVAAVTRLANSADVLRWNTDKTYLRELAEAGLPVVETTWLHPGDEFAVPPGGEYVVKPAVSAGSNDTNRYVAGTHDALAIEHASRLLADGRVVMVQPYLHDVDTAGETALLFFAGTYSHAIRKAALLEQAMAELDAAYRPETISARQPSAAELDAAESILDAVSALRRWPREQFTYARVDLVPGSDSTPTLIELELAEPSMFLLYDPPAADRFAAAIADLVAPPARDTE